MKQISFFIPLLGTLLLSGCAGTSTEFECNATTSDTCMTMEQANEKAKKLEQSSEAKPVAASLPRLADIHGVPVKHTEHLSIVVGPQNLMYPFRENRSIARLVAKVSGSDIKLVFCQIIDVGEIVSLRIASATD